ncbi:MAG: hypothetical protein E6R04_05075 [Spirochaetes bacterium]|nr:MAG: hypothetical protein E6R04_05075 [Spirochaetota bacterium]
MWSTTYDTALTSRLRPTVTGGTSRKVLVILSHISALIESESGEGCTVLLTNGERLDIALSYADVESCIVSENTPVSK